MTGLHWLLLLFTFWTTAGCVALVAAPTEAERLARQKLRATLGPGAADAAEPEELQRPLLERLFGPLLLRLRKALYARTPQGTREAIQAKLIAAGRPADVGALLARKALFALGFGLLLAWSLLRGGFSLMGLTGVAAGAVAGWRLPDFSLARATTARRRAIARSLPDALDLLCTSVEAGLGLDGAIQKVAEKLGGPLGVELAIYLKDVRLGRSREEALRAVARRVDVKELRSAVASIIQAERLGASLARVLRVQSEELRIRRRVSAQERAMQIPVKILFPLVLFIFPAMFVVILGPAVLQIMTMFVRHPGG